MHRHVHVHVHAIKFHSDSCNSLLQLLSLLESIPDNYYTHFHSLFFMHRHVYIQCTMHIHNVQNVYVYTCTCTCTLHVRVYSHHTFSSPWRAVSLPSHHTWQELLLSYEKCCDVESGPRPLLDLTEPSSAELRVRRNSIQHVSSVMSK